MFHLDILVADPSTYYCTVCVLLFKWYIRGRKKKKGLNTEDIELDFSCLSIFLYKEIKSYVTLLNDVVMLTGEILHSQSC